MSAWEQPNRERPDREGGAEGEGLSSQIKSPPSEVREETQEQREEPADQAVSAGVERRCWRRVGVGRLWEGSEAAAGSLLAAGEQIGLLWEHRGLILFSPKHLRHGCAQLEGRRLVPSVPGQVRQALCPQD